MDNYLRASGTNKDDLIKKLIDAGKFMWVKDKKGNQYKHCRKQFTVGKNFKIHNLRCWLTLYLAQKKPQFTWTGFTKDVLVGCKNIERGVKILQEHFEDLQLVSLEDMITQSFIELQDQAELVTLQKDNETIPLDKPEVIQISEPQDMKPKIRCDVGKAFLFDIVLGLGLDEEYVGKQYKKQRVRVISKEDRQNELKEKLISHHNTFGQYITMQNLFLLWMNYNNPSMFINSGALLATEAEVYTFLRALEQKELRLTGFEPPIGKVLKNELSWTLEPGAIEMSYAYGHKWISALSELLISQHTLLNKPEKSLRESSTLKAWEKNLKSKQNSKRKKSYKDRQKTVFQSECPISMKERQSIHLLNSDTWISNRNRAIGLVQAFSISRMDELEKWRVSELHIITYSNRLPTVGSYDIKCLYIEQNEHKNFQDSRIPDKKVIVRRKEFLLCPMSATSMMFFERFVLHDEKPIDLLSDEDYWWNLMFFRSTKSALKGINKQSMYWQRKDIMDLTDTGLAGVVNHADRRIGTWLALLHGLSLEEIKAIGLWQSSQCDKHYSKYSSPHTCAKLSGFSSAMEYDITRERISIERFIQETGETSKDFFRCFMGFIYDARVSSGVNQLLVEGFNAPKNCFDALCHLHLVFFQDLYLYYEYNKDLRMFQADMFVLHHETFHKWIDYCKKCVQDGEPSINQSVSLETQFGSTQPPKVDQRPTDLEIKVDVNAAKLDRLIHLLETSKYKDTFAKNQDNKTPQVNDFDEHSSTKILTKLRPLRDMNIREIVEEWTVGHTSQGGWRGPLMEFDKARIKRTVKYNHSLKTAVLQRRTLFEFFRYNCRIYGSQQEAFAVIEKLQDTIGNGRQCSLSALWKYLTKNKHVWT